MRWNGARVVVTGACGFIGSHLAEALAREGARVKALALYDARGSRGWLDTVKVEGMEVVSGDVRDVEGMRRLVKEAEVVFHLAALIGIPYSYEAPRSYVETNVTGTLNVLEGCREGGVGRLLVISTSEVYGTALEVPIRESHPLQGQSPYSASKIAAEKLAESYYKAFGLPVVVVRPFNTYGPRQSARAVIPTVLMQVLKGERELKLGDVETRRDFNYVGDTVEGLMRLAKSEGAKGEAVNIGTGVDVSIRDVVEAIGRLAGSGGCRLTVREDERRIRPAASEVRRLCADNTKLKTLTGWVPPARLEEGLRLTMDWMKTNLSRYDAGRYYV